MSEMPSGAIADVEAVRSVLLDLRVPRQPGNDAPSPEVEWPILVTFDEPVEHERCLERFDHDWSESHDAVIYGQTREGGWTRTFHNGSSANASYQALQIAVRLPGDAEPRSSDGLARLFSDVSERAASLGALLTEARYPIESAVARAAELGRLRDLIEEREEGCVHARVARKDRFSAEEVERVLGGIGFDARRGGLLTWSNEAGCVGDDPIIGATLETDSRLLLWFAVPRVADPFAVLDAMIAVAALVVRTLGGRVVGEDGEPLDVLAIRAEVADLVERMNAAHLVPGQTGLSVV
jgi:hypothetical protein